MKNTIILSLLGIFAMGAFSPYSMNQQEALNYLAKLGRKAWYATDDTNSEVQRVTKFGYNKDIDSAASESIVSFGGAFTQYGIGAQSISVVSTSANDDAAGYNARSILVQCILEDGSQTNEIVSLDGTTTVTMSNQCEFINRAVVYTTGDGVFNAGDISFIQSPSAVQLAEIPAGKSTTQQILYKVPSDRICYIDDLDLRLRKLGGGTANVRGEFNVLVYSSTQDTIYDIREYFLDTRIDATINRPDFKSEPLRPGEIIAIIMLTDTDDSIVTGSLEMTCKIN